MSKKVVCIVQARMGSTRLPGKVLMKLGSKTVLERVIERILCAKSIDEVIIATTTDEKDDQIISVVDSLNQKVSIFRGSQDDVLARYYFAAKEANADIIVRITSDCPLVDWKIIDSCVREVQNGEEYVSNVLHRTYPRGLDVEAFTFAVLERLHTSVNTKRFREHVTLYIREHTNEFRTKNIQTQIDLSSLRWTLDEEQDLKMIREIYAAFDNDQIFNTAQILELLDQQPSINQINAHIQQKNIKET